MINTTFAFDKASARSFDADGRMRVTDCILSTAEVNPYYGREIPGFTELGLQADTVYQMYRHPDALKAAAESFNGAPLLIKHIVQTAANPQQDSLGGSVHSVRFDGKYLRGDLLVMVGEAIDLIESGQLADLSCGYRYVPVMTSGSVDGQSYDGVMTEIQANHVALVTEGRATDACVADAAISIEGTSMNAKYAADAASPSESEEDKEKTVADSEEVKADSQDIGATLQAIQSQLAEILATLNPEGASDASTDEGEKDAPPSEEQEGTPNRGGSTPTTEIGAMDAAAVNVLVEQAVSAERSRAQGVELAKRETAHVLGDVTLDSAEAIYREALTQTGIDVADIPAVGLRAVWQGVQQARRGHALDAARPAAGWVDRPAAGWADSSGKSATSSLLATLASKISVQS